MTVQHSRNDEMYVNNILYNRKAHTLHLGTQSTTSISLVMDLYNDWRRRALSLMQSYFLYIVIGTTTYKNVYTSMLYHIVLRVQLSNCQRMCTQLCTREYHLRLYK